MRVLRRHDPTGEQIAIIARIRAGVTVIRGAAGSGKTSTALFSLRASAGATINQLRATDTLPARVLVVTYYNSLKGYISEVATEELAVHGYDVDLTISTFDKWAVDTTGYRNIQLKALEQKLHSLAEPFPRDTRFTVDEATYVLGRFPSDQLGNYIGAARTGRGNSPQMDHIVRQQLLDEVVRPYIAFKAENGLVDFFDLANAMLEIDEPKYDVIVVDEAQDLSANQIRAVMAHCAPDGIVTFVTDTAQRIYPRGTTWAECGVTAPRTQSLNINYRNTKEIASLAAGLAIGLPVDADGSRPDPARCRTSGDLPVVLKGKFGEQVDYALAQLANIDLENKTVGFLHLKGGGWFDHLRNRLSEEGHEFCELQGASVWPAEGGNIGLSTLHSAKGLEFDHVFILGLSNEHTAHGEGDEDDQLISLKRLLSMAIGRAKTTVTLGMKPGHEVDILEAVDAALYQTVTL